MREAAGFALAWLLSLSCGSKAEVDPEVIALPPCAVQRSNAPDGWQSIEAPRGELTLSVPRELAATGEAPGMHGGRVWRDGERMLAVTYGYWSLRSFPPESRKCRLSSGDDHIVVIDWRPKSGTSAVAWLVGSGAGEKFPYDVLLVIKSPRASDRRLFDVILQNADW